MNTVQSINSNTNRKTKEEGIIPYDDDNDDDIDKKKKKGGKRKKLQGHRERKYMQ